ncbi:MAG TPA: glycosyltransferase [Anaerolineales bacterium]|nr:glycosyltransferase [Anaerolineae bacterium]HIQ02407.1 glycosyltransferase [Anaerolineales bacterium]
MSDVIAYVLATLYALVTLWLTVYGLNSWILAVLYWRNGRRSHPVPPIPRHRLPTVTVQLPVYNEKHVVERLMDAVARLDYPRDRLQIQVLDDSTDETSRLVAARVALHRERGLDIQVLHRSHREGFKGGALAWGLTHARGELVAVFDADFVPRSDFLLHTVPHFLTDPRLGMVQARWSHLNADYSLLTRIQALALDGHFVVEQTARNRSGLPMHFNGTAGVWRRACIEASGGWQTDTVCEDLDLSYRAQLAGWRCLYLPEVEGPAELPPQILAFKRQQARWAQGSIQCLRKLARPLARSRRLSPVQKLMGLIHLSGYLAHPLMILLLLIALPLLFHPHLMRGPLNLLGPVCLGPFLVYATSQWALYPDWKRRLLTFPLLVLVGTGIAWNNSLAAWRGLTRWGGVFARTPKFHLEGRGGEWAHSRYRLGDDRAVAGEVALALYALVAAGVAWATGNTDSIPFLLLYGAAFGLVAGLSLAEMIGPRRRGLPVGRRSTRLYKL